MKGWRRAKGMIEMFSNIDVNHNIMLCYDMLRCVAICMYRSHLRITQTHDKKECIHIAARTGVRTVYSIAQSSSSNERITVVKQKQQQKKKRKQMQWNGTAVE
jgi:hypothetical protein